jgi:RNA polymerase sigma-70 factor, ECF subfamily
VSGDARTDAELVAAAGQGDGDAFALLVRRYIRASTLLAAQLLGDADDADDVVQDAFTIVYRDARGFDGSRPFGPWLFAIVRRLASNRRARTNRRERLLRWFPHESRPAAAPLPDESLITALDAAAAVHAMAHLPSMQRACFELVVVRELPIQEVAAMHRIAESTVRQHVFRARAALREVLKAND